MSNGLAWLGWLFGLALLLLVAVEAFEVIELFVDRRRETFVQQPPSFYKPFVSLHVPIHAEPPDVVKRTLRALQALQYDRIEVLVIDNNTEDEALWRPIERFCQELGPRFRFFRLPRWPGYKAGALNFALANTSPDASVIGVVDSDYEVDTDFLAALVGHFAKSSVGFVQAPQNYRDWESRPFFRMSYWEYWQFFAVSMHLRNRRNAILMHGTMVMVRKSALREVGGWAEWCLTEDSELGLRLLAAGYHGVYCGKTYGRGLVPFSYRAYWRQRQRWVTGGVQTLRRHWPLFLPWRRSLTAAQKFHYLQGWAPWLRDGIIVASLPLIIVLSVFSLGLEDTPGAVLPLASAVLALVVYLGVRQIIIYRLYLKRPWADGFCAGAAIFGLVPHVGVAWLRGWLQTCHDFHRTPKEPEPRSLRMTRFPIELVLGFAMAVLALGILFQFGTEGVRAAAGLGSSAVLCLSSEFTRLTE
ncbi:MAG: glycosyltransferase [Shimia sp.]|nr:glycosyltransferase [Shimia sp.]